MSEVKTGLLLFFVSLQELIGRPANRCAMTITIAQITFPITHVAVIVQSRLSGMDQSLEEAAMDLGGRPFQVTRDISLPMVIFSKVNLGESPDINALATLLISLAFVAVLIAGMVIFRQRRRGQT